MSQDKIAAHDEQIPTPPVTAWGEEALHAWTHGWRQYIRYLEAVGRAKTMQDVIAAQADWITDGAAGFSLAAKVNGPDAAPTLAPTFPD